MPGLADDVAYNYGTYVQPVKGWGAFGLGIIFLSYGISEGTDEAGQPTGTFGSNELCARQAQYIKVLYVMEDDKAQLRLITTGIADSKRVELLEGAALGDTVIVGPYRSLDQLRDGKKVALLEEGKKEGQKQSGEEEKTAPEEQAAAQKDAPGPSEDENG